MVKRKSTVAPANKTNSTLSDKEKAEKLAEWEAKNTPEKMRQAFRNKSGGQEPVAKKGVEKPAFEVTPDRQTQLIYEKNGRFYSRVGGLEGGSVQEVATALEREFNQELKFRDAAPKQGRATGSEGKIAKEPSYDDFKRLMDERQKRREAPARAKTILKEGRARLNELQRRRQIAASAEKKRQDDQFKRRGVKEEEEKAAEKSKAKVGAWWKWERNFTFKGATKITKSLTKRATFLGKAILFVPLFVPVFLSALLLVGVIGFGTLLVDQSFTVGLAGYGAHGFAALVAVVANFIAILLNGFLVGGFALFNVGIVGAFEVLLNGLRFLFGKFFNQVTARLAGVENPVEDFEANREAILDPALKSTQSPIPYLRPGIPGQEPFLVNADASIVGPFGSVLGPVTESGSVGGAVISSARSFVEDAIMRSIEGLTQVVPT